jgi:ATP-dependent Clp protease ATP-binding subunit ClpB
MIKNQLKKFVLGQDHVFDPLEKYIKIGEAGLSPTSEPKGVFLFTGPTGTGKTETAKAMAEILKSPLLRFDMSEYREDQKFLEDLCYQLDNNTEGIVLLDEIEKGDMLIFDYFLQILSEARITYNRKTYNLTEYYIVMTSNIGSQNIMGQENFAVARRIVERLVKAYFRPEFLGRIRRDCQICFRPLEYDIMKRIVEQKVKHEIMRLQEKDFLLTYDEKILPFLMNVGVNPEFGARPIVQTVQKYVSLAIINSGKTKGQLVCQNGQLLLV